MLKKTFCHIDGISKETEIKLWQEGFTEWEICFLETKTPLCISQKKLEIIKQEILFSNEALEKRDLNYFRKKLEEKEHYRLSEFAKICFLDIETTGLSRWTDELTMIGIYDGENPHIFIKGENLEDAKEKLNEFDMIVTFNGKTFDLPFIRQKLGIEIQHMHLDLRYMLKEFGLSGGLKKIEIELGITRAEEVVDIDGREAVRLWRRYERGDKLALEKLKAYNKEDIQNLKILLDYYIKKKREENVRYFGNY